MMISSDFCVFLGFVPDVSQDVGLFGNDETVFPCPLTSDQKNDLASFVNQKLFCDFLFDDGVFTVLICFEVCRDEETTTEFLDRKIRGLGN